MIFIIEDDIVMGGVMAMMCGGGDVRVFSDAISAMGSISEGVVPDLIFLDVLLDGPDAFTFLNELVSYSDTAKIPVVVVTSLDLADRDLSAYGVVGVLSKETMKPGEMKEYAKKYAG